MRRMEHSSLAGPDGAGFAALMYRQIIFPLILTAGLFCVSCGDKGKSGGEGEGGENGSVGAVPKPSPALLQVAEYLGEPGAHYSLTDISGDAEKFAGVIDGLLESFRESGMGAEVPSGLNLERLVRDLNIHYVTAIGQSAHKVGSHWHNRMFLDTNGRRNGVLSVLGGEGREYVAPVYAPADADLVLEIELNLKEIRDIARRIATAFGPEARKGVADAFAEAVIEGGLTLGELFGKFEVRASLVVTLDPSNPISLGEGISVPSVSVIARLDRAKWVWDAFAEQLAEGFEQKSEGGLEMLVAPEPMETPMGVLSPVIAFERRSGAIWVALDQKDLGMARDESKSNLAGSEEFQAAMAGLPEKGNALAFSSKRLAQELGKLVKNAERNLEAEVATGIGMVTQFLLPDLSQPQAYAAAIANNEDGVLLALNGPEAIKGTSMMGSTGTIVALSALATPQIFKALKRAELAENLNKARQVKFALDSYAADNDGEFPAMLSQLVPDHMDAESFEALKPDTEEGTGNWMYVEGLKNLDRGDLIILFSPDVSDGKRIIVRVDGAARAVDEEEFQALIDEQ